METTKGVPGRRFKYGERLVQFTVNLLPAVLEAIEAEADTTRDHKADVAHKRLAESYGIELHPEEAKGA